MKLIEMIDVSRSFGEGELKIDALKNNIAIEASGEFVAVRLARVGQERVLF